MRHLLTILLVVLVLTSTAAARTWYVHPSGSGDAPTIQAAIDSSSHGDTIELANGTFTGTGNRDMEYEGKRITIRSQSGDPSLCIINCEGTMADRHWAFYIGYGEDSLSVLRDITMTGGSYDEGGAMHIEESSPLIQGCVFVSNQADEGAGIFTYNSNSIIRDCWFESNFAGLRGAGLHLKEMSPAVEGCTFVDNMTMGDGSGICCDRNVATTIRRCTFYANEAWGIGSGISCHSTSPAISYTIVASGVGAEAIGCGTGASPVLTCSDLYDNAGGDWVGCIAAQLGVSGNISANPRFCNPGAGEFTLHTTSPCKSGGGGCGLQGAWPVACAMRTFVLNDSGTGDFPTIQAAVDVAWSLETIELLDGTYTGDGNRDIDFNGKAIEVRSQSGNPEACIIDCQADFYERHRGFYLHSGEAALSKITGLTVTNAYSPQFGGAVFCEGASPAISNCIFDGNSALLEGAGVAFNSSPGSPSLDNCIIKNNFLINDWGGGVSCYKSDADISNCVFINNTAVSGGYGGGLACVQSDATITGCTFYANQVDSASRHGATFYSWDSSPVFENCILAFGLNGPAVFCEGTGVPVFTCCDIYGNEDGDWVGCIASQDSTYGNFHEDPRFCDPEGGDLNLHFTSPCTPANSGGCGLIGAHGVGCGPETYVLNDAGTGDFPTIQAAIDVAWDSDTIELLDGTYTGNGNRDLDTKGKALTLRGQSGDASSCVIDAEADSADQHRVMTVQGSGSLETRIEDITITGGYIYHYGAGVHCYDTTPVFLRCILSNNTTRNAPGSGLYIDTGSPATVTECVFAGNVAVSRKGGGLATASDLTMSDCEFSGNDAENGAALWTYGAVPGGVTVAITDCNFHDHSIASGSVVSLVHTYGEMSRCVFSDNTAPEGALFLQYRDPLISECTFFQNSGDGCTALRTWSCTAEIRQCTFADNHSSGGSVWLAGGSPQPEMNSCIIAFNTNSVAVACTDSFPVLACCDIYGNDLGDWVGCISGDFGNSGNVRLDPLFCGELNPDEPYSLQLESPCMADSAPPGCPRLGAHDVGCTGGSGVEEPWATESIFMSRPLPNPAGATTQIAFALPPGALHEKAQLDVYDIAGRHVRSLLDRIVASGELQKVTWNGRDEKGTPVSSGVYFFRLQSGGEGRTAKVVIAR